MIIKNEAPELKRLRRAMSIQWIGYRNWIDKSMDTIVAIQMEAACKEEEDEFPALLKAQYIYEMWKKS